MEPTFALLDRFEDSGEILSAIKGAIRDATHETGTVNVLIAGRTGVGKSTLINEVFQGRLAETGQGSRSPRRPACSRRRASHWRSTTPAGWS